MLKAQRPDVGNIGPELKIKTGLEFGQSSKIARPRQSLVTTAREWRSPTELPDLRRVGLIAIDTETNDEGLRADRGSAWPWRGGYICGISVAWRDESGIRAQLFPAAPSRQRELRTRERHPLAERPYRRRRSHSSPRTDFMTGAGCAPISASRCRRPSSSKRSAHWQR